MAVENQRFSTVAGFVEDVFRDSSMLDSLILRRVRWRGMKTSWGDLQE